MRPAAPARILISCRSPSHALAQICKASALLPRRRSIPATRTTATTSWTPTATAATSLRRLRRRRLAATTRHRRRLRADDSVSDDDSVSGDSDGGDTIITPNAKRHKCDRVRSGKVSKLADGKRHRGIGGKQLTPKQMSNARLKILNPKASYKWRGVTYPNMVAETFEIRFGRVWCCACRKHVHLKRLAQHIHGSAKETRATPCTGRTLPSTAKEATSSSASSISSRIGTASTTHKGVETSHCATCQGSTRGQLGGLNKTTPSHT